MPAVSNKEIDKRVAFNYYTPINEKQKRFHASKARHKALIGGVGGGKSYPAEHEAFFIAFDNPGHEFAVLRNTWDSLADNVEKDMLRISEKVGASYKWDAQKHDLYLHNGTQIHFRPLTLKIEQIKGMHLCGFFVDDPDVARFNRTIAFLYSRLRNPPYVVANYFESIICANWEGRDWLWKTYMRNREEGGDAEFAYWICPTQDNPSLPENYISDQALLHSKAWMDRYVYCDIEHTYTGLIYDEYDPKLHDADLGWCDEDKKGRLTVKITSVDLGISDPSVVLDMATDGESIYIYGEWYQPARGDEVGMVLKRKNLHTHLKANLIDPSSAIREKTSGDSMLNYLSKNYGVKMTPANNDIMYGIEMVKSVMTPRGKKVYFYIDPQRCPHTVQELEIYRWKDSMYSEFEEMTFKEKPIDKDNHAMDCIRYGITFLNKYRNSLQERMELMEIRNKKMWEDRLKNLPMYQEQGMRDDNPDTLRLRQIHKLGTKEILRRRMENVQRREML